MEFHDWDEFTRGYTTCMLWAESDESDDSGGESLSVNYDWGDFSIEAKEQIEEDCRRFQIDCETLLGIAVSRGCDMSQLGHDFWLTRNHHGSGFWDRDELEADDIGSDLTTIAESFGEISVLIGDDNQLHLG